jgi:hypothetical protein
MSAGRRTLPASPWSGNRVCPRANAGREGTPVLTVVTDNEPAPAGASGAVEEPSAVGGSLIDEIVREGARRMLAAALEAEVAAYIAAHADQLDERGRRLVVRNGRAEPRRVLTSAGAVEVVAPGSTTSMSTRRRVSGAGSPRRSCRRGAASRRRSTRCCRCCTCTACPRSTSCWR